MQQVQQQVRREAVAAAVSTCSELCTASKTHVLRFGLTLCTLVIAACAQLADLTYLHLNTASVAACTACAPLQDALAVNPAAISDAFNNPKLSTDPRILCSSSHMQALECGGAALRRVQHHSRSVPRCIVVTRVQLYKLAAEACSAG